MSNGEGRKESNGKVLLEYFPQSKIDLATEVRHHPTLIALLQKHPQSEFELLLCEIAAYCEVVLDGDYLPEDINQVCKILEKKLRAKRAGVLLLDASIQKMH